MKEDGTQRWVKMYVHLVIGLSAFSIAMQILMHLKDQTNPHELLSAGIPFFNLGKFIPCRYLPAE